jgi:protein-disulfide isomerase
MHRLCRYMTITGLASCLFGITAICSASVLVQGKKSIIVKSSPVATAVAEGGKMVFVLTDKGTVEIYTDTGTLKGTIHVGRSATGISTSWRGDKLYVTEAAPKQVKIISLEFIAAFDLKGSPFKGPQDAPVTIVEFSDFQCPFCSRMGPILDKVLEKYPERVRLVFKNYPLTRIHSMAMKAAVASLAAQEQGRYWEYHDKLFENHKTLSDEKLLEIAEASGLDMGRFERDRKDPKLSKLIKRDSGEARQNGVHGTPTLFVNGHRLKSMSARAIEQAVERELKKVRCREKQASRVKPERADQNRKGAIIVDSDSEDL